MPETKRRVVEKGKPPEPVEFTAEFTGVGEVKMYGCPVCGHNRQDENEMKLHLKTHGGEA